MRYRLSGDPMTNAVLEGEQLMEVETRFTWHASRDATEPLPVDADGRPILPPGENRALLGMEAASE